MKRTHKQLIIGILISGLFLWLAFRRVPLAELWSFIKTINYLWTLPLVVLLVGSMYWRAIRWRLLLPSSRNIPASRLFGPLIIGFGLNNVFPARAGEVLRPLALSKQEGVPFGEGMGTVVMERIFDSLMLLLLFFAVLVFVPFGGITKTWDARKAVSGAQINYAIATGALLVAAAAFWLGSRTAKRQRATTRATGNGGQRKGSGVALLGIALLLVLAALAVVLLKPCDPQRTYTFGKEYVLSSEAIRALTKKTAFLIAILLAGVVAILFKPVRSRFVAMLNRMTWLPAGLRGFTTRMLEAFALGLDSLRSPKRIFWILVHSVVVWVAVALAFWITSFGMPNMQLSVMEAHGFLVLTCVAIMIPAAPGYWGLYEVGGAFALLAMGVTKDEGAALGFTLVVHFVQWLPITLLGLYYAAKIHIRPGEASTRPH